MIHEACMYIGVQIFIAFVYAMKIWVRVRVRYGYGLTRGSTRGPRGPKIDLRALTVEIYFDTDILF